jgi:hypothetical protein
VLSEPVRRGKQQVYSSPYHRAQLAIPPSIGWAGVCLGLRNKGCIQLGLLTATYPAVTSSL